ncbi:hypothetical protein NMY22_g6460 [Coprinellus aureogranulatus]|nr:hypothetical protein NMY22_g6460 [Coprinellus aureogranulatus]
MPATVNPNQDDDALGGCSPPHATAVGPSDPLTMTKRSSQGTPVSTPKTKRPKNDAKGQLQLDSFFTSPSKRRLLSGSAPKAQDEPIDVDALDGSPGLSMAGPSKLSPGSVQSLPQPFATEDTSASRKPTVVFGAKAVKPARLEFQPLDVDPVFYDPSLQPWTPSGAPYSFLAHTFTTLSQTRSRITILHALTNALSTILQRHPASLLPSLYLLSNSLSPAYVGVELGIGGSIISKAIQQVSGLTAAALKQLYTTTGDVGDVAFEAKSKVRTLIPHAPLTIQQVYESLLKISACKGSGAAKAKEKIVEKLLVAGSGDEVRFLVRTLTLNLRVGAVRTSILTALARAFVLHGQPQGHTTSEEDSKFWHASQKLLERIKPLPPATKKKELEDVARQELKALFTGAEGLIKQVYVRHPCYDDIVHALLEYGFHNLAGNVPLSVGIPLHPTLGSPTRSLDEIYERLGDLPFSAEFKYDGQRAQIHANREVSGKVLTRIFSRHLEDMTTKYPDVILLVEELMQKSPSMHSFILDAEIVAVDSVTEELKSFQELSNRARKDVRLADIKVCVAVFVFDLLYHNGEPYLQQTFRKRREALKRNFPPLSPAVATIARLRHVESCESELGRAAIQEFWEQALESRCEGLMVKVLDNEPVDSSGGDVQGARKKVLPATYEPDKRTSAWLKLKKDYVDTIGDSLDLVPIGAWYGNGRKAGWWSPILLGLWDPETGRHVAICKCMSGFTDAFYKSLLERYRANSDACSQHPDWDCDFGFRPDVYLKPTEVWEIRGADITESPVSVAAQGLVSETRGLSLRFPRFIKAREDKGIEQASTPRFLASLWRKQQKTAAGRGGVDDGDLIDVDIEESDVDEEDVDISWFRPSSVFNVLVEFGGLPLVLSSHPPTDMRLVVQFLPALAWLLLASMSNLACAEETVQDAAASRPRVSLLGNVTVFTDIAKVPDREAIQECYLSKHHDAKWWLPDDENAAHIGKLLFLSGRLNDALKKAVYFVGGFGGLHYIGWIPLDIYQNAKHTSEAIDPATESDSQVVLNE